MTFFHFTNCVVLAYAPYVIVYKTSGLGEYNAFWKCIQAGVMYLFTQLCKMMFLATFFPSSEVISGQFDLIGEFLRSTVDLADMFGLYFIMTQITGKGELKFMIAGVGWALAELITTGFVPMWVGARGLEFDWKYIQLSLGSNVNLVQHIASAMLVWLFGRTDLNKSSLPIVIFLLAVSCYRTFIFGIFSHMFLLGSWSVLIGKLFMTSLTGLISLQLFRALTSYKETNNYY